ncbi:MAG: 50S ribosomal protein L15 [Candidatus Gracilibacteria bacterium]|jgi:large subunit ribosomal protein L15|nr:50S ribosomal protein L15 [Candidatus Gracilibacteria bacterium]
MKLHELKPAEGARKSKIRRGRGNASGKGTFSGRGCKGQNARSGGGVRLGFEGGQTPLLRRIPKLKGFKNPNRVDFVPFNLDAIEANFSDAEMVSIETLADKGMLKKNAPVKILGNGELTKKVNFDGVYVSASAKSKIEKAGGKIENELKNEKKEPSKKKDK